MDYYLVVFFCFAITLHNIEEAIWLPKWSQNATKFHKPVSANEFLFAVIVITMLAYLAAFSYFYWPESNFTKWMFVGFLGSMIFNAIFPHLAATIVMQKYAPGLVTGLFLNIPINSMIIYRMLSNNSIIWTELIISTVVVGIILLTLIPILFKVGGNITPA